jgi:hypothetical protein
MRGPAKRSGPSACAARECDGTLPVVAPQAFRTKADSATESTRTDDSLPTQLPHSKLSNYRRAVPASASAAASVSSTVFTSAHATVSLPTLYATGSTLSLIIAKSNERKIRSLSVSAGGDGHTQQLRGSVAMASTAQLARLKVTVEQACALAAGCIV